MISDRRSSLAARNCSAETCSLRCLKTPREVRNALRYVLLDRKHHAAEQRFSKQWIDPFSSAAWFGGWAERIRADEPWKRELLAMARPERGGHVRGRALAKLTEAPR